MTKYGLYCADSTPGKSNKTLIIGVTVPIVVVGLMLLIIVLIYIWRKSNKEDEEGKSLISVGASNLIMHVL